MVQHRIAPRTILEPAKVVQGTTAIESYSYHGANNRLSSCGDYRGNQQRRKLTYGLPLLACQK